MIKQKDLYRIRNKLGLTQRQVAELIGRTMRTYQSYESGERIMPLELLELLEYKLCLEH